LVDETVDRINAVGGMRGGSGERGPLISN